MESVIDEKMLAAWRERMKLKPSDLDGVAAYRAAETTAMCKLKGERDTEFVKRIVCAYMNAV